MKKIAIALLFSLSLLQVGAQELQWLTDLSKAQSQAKQTKKLVIMDFTGSDWCPWCIKLHDEVLNTPEFKAYAKKNVVPVIVDFPRRKKLPDAQVKANDALQEKYKIEGYPTVVVLNSAGKKIGVLGYEEGGPKPFIEKLEKLKKDAEQS